MVDLTSFDSAALNANDLHSLLSMLNTYEEMHKVSGARKFFEPGTPYGIDKCPKHAAFFAAGSKYYERVFMAGNRIGKTVSGALECAYHATGDYPDWWEGHRFDCPTDGWAAGDTTQTTRDTVLKELLGPPDAIGTGTIPLDRILKIVPHPRGLQFGVDRVEIRHVSGGISKIGFKSYEQGVRAFYGTAKHYIWLDEECPEIIYNECLIRTMKITGRAEPGILFVTFTPLHGVTPFIVNFMKNAELLAGAQPVVSGDIAEFIDTDALKINTRLEAAKAEVNRIVSSRAVVQAGWADAPWLDKETIVRMKSNTPPHLVDARMYGHPSVGSGNVYQVALENILVDPFEIPAGWKHLYALDVGWNRTAALHAAIDPNDGTIYVYAEHYVGDARPELHAAAIKSRGEWIRGVVDPAANGRAQHDGQRLIDIYRKLGLKLIPAKNEVEAGIFSCYSRLSNGRLKIFNTLRNFQKEYMVYARDLNGKIIKENDHLMDCMRYLVLNTEIATKNVSSRTKGGHYGGHEYDI